jgi:hypothetical protein
MANPLLGIAIETRAYPLMVRESTAEVFTSFRANIAGWYLRR